MVRLRPLNVADAPLMLEWMHDSEVQKGFKKDMLHISLEKAEAFCKSATIPETPKDGDSLHFAIAGDNDEYLGTVSLKDLDFDNGFAEYAIVVRSRMQGNGVARRATGLVLQKAFDEYGLHRVYLNVLADNEPAIRLYERCGFTFEGEFREHIRIGDHFVNWKWYGILAEEFREEGF